MKKIIGLLVICSAIMVYAETKSASYSVVGDVQGTTNYVGKAVATEGESAPSTNSAVWNITRIITDASGNLVSVKHAYGSGTKELSLWTTAWTNRVAATYK